MRKKIAIFGLIACLCINIFGCKSENKSKETEATSNIETSSIEQKETESKTEENTSKEIESNTIDSDVDKDDDIIINRQEMDDGSISVIAKGKDDKLLQTVDYDAGNNWTIKVEYEYNEKGLLCIVRDYEGPGNLVDEFFVGNHDNATMSGMNNYEPSEDQYVDLDTAFEPTVEELAPLYKKAEDIYEKYGVAILIADKVCADTSGAELCYDYKKISDSIDLTEKCLECYPKDFFRNFSSELFNPIICVQLVGTGSHAGIYKSGDHFKIVQIDVNDYSPEDGVDDEGSFFSYTLHHEIGHMIADTLMERADNSFFSLTEERWNSFNPDGFEYVGYYDDDKESDLYCKDGNSEYFVYSYSCSTPDEDRAIIFGNAMTYYQGYSSMGFNEKIDAKLVYLSGCIKNGFTGVDWSERPAWEYILDYNHDSNSI